MSNLDEKSAEVAEAYREAAENEHPIFADAPFIELGPVNREWTMIRLVDLQTAATFGQRHD